jgi:hypothetical protein
VLLRVLALVCLLPIASCATTAQDAQERRASNLKVGVAFLAAGAGSIAVGAGLFGYALAHKPATQDTPELALFLPGVAIFGIGIPFFVTGAVFTVTSLIPPR